MKVACFSSFTFSYLNRARVLFASLRQIHPEWNLIALITDRPPDGFRFDIDDEPFDEVVWVEQLGISALSSWLFKHDIIEVCTAVKGPFIRQLCDTDADIIVYLDPDTCVFNSLEPIIAALDTYDIILTPHQLTPDNSIEAVIDNEVTSLQTGIYNLGFIAIKTTGEGLRFADWWKDRLLSLCFDDIPRGLFVDQRWCDHVPSFFERVKIMRDPGYNVASWNLSNRKIAVSDAGQFTVNGFTLRFWHFTKLGPIGDVMTKKYAGSNFQVYELWRWYRERIKIFSSPEIPARYWYYGFYENGEIIQKPDRVLYRSRSDLQAAFPNPYISGDESYQNWLKSEGPANS